MEMRPFYERVIAKGQGDAFELMGPGSAKDELQTRRRGRVRRAIGDLGGRMSRSRFGHSFANSKSNELPPIVDVQLFHNGFTVAIDSLGASTE